MGFLKRHFEKIALALALLVLIGTAGFLALRVDNLSRLVGDQGPLPPPPDGKGIKPMNVLRYQRTITSLSEPPLWESPASNMFPSIEVASVVETGVVVVVREPEVRLVRIVREPFKYMFTAYTWDQAEQAGHNFQINVPRTGYTYFVADIGQRIPDVSESNQYTLVSFDRQIEKRFDSSINAEIEQDRSVLIIAQTDGDPVKLTRNQIADPNPLAELICRGATDTIRVRRGDTFNCLNRTYKVVDINGSQMLIRDTKSGEEQRIGLPEVNQEQDFLNSP